MVIKVLSDLRRIMKEHSKNFNKQIKNIKDTEKKLYLYWKIQQSDSTTEGMK